MFKHYPADIDQLLEFDKIRENLRLECVGTSGMDLVQGMQPICDLPLIKAKLERVREFDVMSRQNSQMRVFPYEDISHLKRFFHIEGYVYDREDILKVILILEFEKNIHSIIGNIEKEDYPELLKMWSGLADHSELLDRLKNTFDQEGNINRNASPELIALHRLWSSKQREASQRFSQIVRQFQKQGWLSDNKESYKNGRRVLSVPSEHKRKIKGIIHDESSSGKTTFIEPEGVIEINNDLFDVERGIAREEFKILKQISDLIRFCGSDIMRTFRLLAEMDFIQAQSRFANKINGVIPILLENQACEIIQLRHPLLYLKYQREGREVVPFDLRLDKENRILLVSGPNAGGKSILLKSIGLAQMMLQCGMPIPLKEGSKMGVFKGIFADVGDQQSLEDDLSTYSSHLSNMKYFLENAGPGTLVLIDEFGSGTDPKIGGAIAEAILRRFRHLKTFGVITTHFGNLKIYANNSSGLINGAMTFDRKNLTPTYEFTPGEPGSSFGFEIAKKVGIHSAVLKYAREKSGKNTQEVDGMLADLQRERAKLQDKMNALKKEEEEVKRKAKNFEHLHKELEIRRKKMKLHKREQELAMKSRLQEEMEKIIRDAKKSQNIEKSKEILKTFKKQSKNLIAEQEQIKEDINKKEFGGKVEWKEGMHAKMRSGTEIGQVVSISKNKAILAFNGGLRMEVHFRDLIPAKEPIEQRKETSVHTEIIYKGTGFNNKLDIRGLRYREATDLLKEYLEKALIASTPKVTITHGKGEGALRKALLETLKDFPATIQVHHPPEEEGGLGQTILTFS